MNRNGNSRNGKLAKKRDEITCVQLSKETRNKLAEMGKKSDTFEKIILNLMDNPEEPCGENVIGESQNDE